MAAWALNTRSAGPSGPAWRGWWSTGTKPGEETPTASRDPARGWPSITSSHVPLANPEPMGSLHSLLREAPQVRGHRHESSAQAGPETATQLLQEKTTESVEIPDCRDAETGQQDPWLGEAICTVRAWILATTASLVPVGPPDLCVLQQRTGRGPAASPGPWGCSSTTRGRGCANAPGAQLACSLAGWEAEALGGDMSWSQTWC